jgi:DNA-directed RNA polymerase specialized sigma24 family protein
VLHEAVLQVLLSARSYRGDAPLEQWADRLFLRRAHQWRRSSARLTCVDEDLERLAVTEPPDGGLGDTLPRPLAEYLAELPETYRRALLLRYGLDHSVPEVAVSVGCSARRAKKRIFEGMAMLRMRIFRDVRRCQVPRDLARAEEVRPPC